MELEARELVGKGTDLDERGSRASGLGLVALVVMVKVGCCCQ